ncbi:MAG TPA: DNA-processing protein DprA [Methylomirabilota bacterium]|nr:DNA-processing protein DprA [Methylomirabilota bacterium]
MSAWRVLVPDGPDFPAQLRSIPDPPSSLWMRGTVQREDALAIAVVGSRRATPHGLALAERLAGDLAARGVTVVSGLARGIDSAAHRGALAAGGRTIAVLGSGVDRVYPPENRRLAAEIAARGAVLSQFAPGMPALAHHFPIRNRVIAGLALGVVVVEAAEASGSLITAGHAADLGREIMAMPGPAGAPSSRGAHHLIRDGAALVEGWEDVVALLPTLWRACVGRPAPAPSDETDAAADPLLALIGPEPASIEELIERSGVPASHVAVRLLDLELDGRVRQLPGKRFVRIPRG